MNGKKVDVKLIAKVVGLVAMAGIVYYLVTSVVPRVMVMLTKATVATKVSVGSSYVLGEKLLARADGKDKCVVNVFLADETGKGVAGKSVSLEGMEMITAINEVSDDTGKASFEMVSKTEGQFKITASVGGVVLPRGVTVTFRN